MGKAKGIAILVVILVLGVAGMSFLNKPKAPTPVAEKQLEKYELVNELTNKYSAEGEAARTAHKKEWAEVDRMAEELNKKITTLSQLEEKSARATNKMKGIDDYFSKTFDVPPSEVVAQIEDAIDQQYTAAAIRPSVKEKFELILKCKENPTLPECVKPTASVNIPGAPEKTEAADASF